MYKQKVNTEQKGGGEVIWRCVTPNSNCVRVWGPESGIQKSGKKPGMNICVPVTSVFWRMRAGNRSLGFAVHPLSSRLRKKQKPCLKGMMMAGHQAFSSELHVCSHKYKKYLIFNFIIKDIIYL